MELETETLASMRAARLPGPPELLPGRPDAVVDLQNDEGAPLVRARWRYSDAQVQKIDFVEVGSEEDPLGPGEAPNRTHDIDPHAAGADFDDSTWRVLQPAETQLRLSTGRVCFNWYRVTVTIPEHVGVFDPAGCTVVFEVVLDDYAEIWVNGRMPHALGETAGPVVAGFNAPQPCSPDRRCTTRRTVPDCGVRDQRSDFHIAAQLHLDAHGDARLLCR